MLEQNLLDEKSGRVYIFGQTFLAFVWMMSDVRPLYQVWEYSKKTKKNRHLTGRTQVLKEETINIIEQNRSYNRYQDLEVIKSS